MRKPLRTKKESRDTVAPGITRSVGMGRMTSMCATTTMSTATPRRPFHPGTSPKLRVGSGGAEATLRSDWPVLEVSSIPRFPPGCEQPAAEYSGRIVVTLGGERAHTRAVKIR